MVAQAKRLIASWITLAVGVLSLLVFTGIASAQMLSNPNRGPYDANWERIQHSRVIVVGVDPSIPPFGQDTPTGPIGFDPAVAQELGRRLGLEVRFVLLTFDGLYDTLLLGYADLVIAALRPDPLRTDRTRYTIPYFDAGHILLSMDGVQQLSALRGKRLAVEFASEGDIAARQVEGVSIERFFTAQEAIDAVLQGDSDAALVDRISASLYLSQHENTELQISAQTIIPDPYVIAIRRSDWRLFEAVQAELLAMQADGTLEALTAEWLADVPQKN
jgi:ABC-type amino acid transport substrate-binding protein